MHEKLYLFCLDLPAILLFALSGYHGSSVVLGSSVYSHIHLFRWHLPEAALIVSLKGFSVYLYICYYRFEATADKLAC